MNFVLVSNPDTDTRLARTMIHCLPNSTVSQDQVLGRNSDWPLINPGLINGTPKGSYVLFLGFPIDIEMELFLDTWTRVKDDLIENGLVPMFVTRYYRSDEDKSVDISKFPELYLTNQDPQSSSLDYLVSGQVYQILDLIKVLPDPAKLKYLYYLGGLKEYLSWNLTKKKQFSVGQKLIMLDKYLVHNGFVEVLEAMLKNKDTENMFMAFAGSYIEMMVKPAIKREADKLKENQPLEVADDHGSQTNIYAVYSESLWPSELSQQIRDTYGERKSGYLSVP